MSKRLGVYLMAGAETPALAEAAAEGGADLVEVGFPFSDPLADGPTIRRAAERALAEGMDVDACLECLGQTRRRVEAPLVPMTYAALLEARGGDRFAREVREAGADGLIVADLPIEVWPEVRRIHLVAPTTPTDRIRRAAAATDGWLYLVAVTGTTGAAPAGPERLPDLAARARAATDRPLLAGFGIATPEDAARAAAHADGVVVGSAAIRAAEEGGAEGVRALVASLRVALDEAETVRPRR